MKKALFPILFIFLLYMTCIQVFAANNDNWNEKPVITQVYELAKEKIFIEWEGYADMYQIYVDGKNVATVNLKYGIIDLKSGIHQIAIVPIDYVSKEGSNELSLDVNVKGLGEILGLFGLNGISSLLPNDLGAGFNLDLGALGIDPKDLLQGTTSDTFRINYTVNPLFSAVSEIINATTDFDDNISLSFTDKYNSDIYIVSIKNGNDISYVTYDTETDEAAQYISTDKSTVTILLDSDYLKTQASMIPELDQKYTFSVKLQKWPVNYVDNSRDTSFVLESQESKAYNYTPYAAWKNEPKIIFASQTADGQITLEWEHEDNSLGCEYTISKLDMILGVKTGEQEIGKTSDSEFVVKDLLNGKYSFSVTPIYFGEKGYTSQAVSADINNSWEIAPSLECKEGDNREVILNWTSIEGIESYHITVSVGDGSVLRFVNLDYKKYAEIDIPAELGNMEYVYTYDQDSEKDINLKFEMYGVRHTGEGIEQRSPTVTQTINIK